MDTINNLRNALQAHFTEEGLKILSEEIDRRIEDWYDYLQQFPDDAVAESRIAVLSGLTLALDNIV